MMMEKGKDAVRKAGGGVLSDNQSVRGLLASTFIVISRCVIISDEHY